MTAARRLALPAELPLVMPLVRAYYIEAHRRGHTDIRPTVRSMEFLEQLAGDYLEERLAGACTVLVGAQGLRGFSLAGALPGELPWDTDLGRQAFAWGTWVRPDWRGAGHGSALSLLVQDRLRDLGIDTLLGGYRFGRPLADVEHIGFTPHQVLGIRRL